MDGFLKKEHKNNFKIDAFSFYSRYLSGGEALKELRGVSRKRFSLAQAGLNYFDTKAHQLVKQTESFIKAVKYLRSKNTITVQDLEYVNKLICTEHRLSGKLRSIQNWVGESLESATYIPPKHTDVPFLLNNFLSRLNCFKTCPSNIYSYQVYFYSHLILIHPFADGNGRCGRVLWCSLEDDDFYQFVPCLVYRLFDERIESHDEAVKLVGKNCLTHYFWKDMDEWSKKINSRLSFIMSDVNEYISSKLLFRNVNPVMKNILYSLVDNPYINPDLFCRLHNIKFCDLLPEILFLERIGLLVKKGVSYEKGKVVFECEFLSQVHNEMENLIFINGD